MQRAECVGCKTHFEQGSKLPLENMHIQLKNYPFPIKQNKHRWNLLKAICSFLNSKGGTIFIGAKDDGQVVGIKMQRKQQDDFKIFVQQITDRILPKIDLSDREDVAVQFIPITNKGKFTSKYIIKVIVRQADPSQLYCFAQKVQLQQSNNGGNKPKSQQFQIFYGYKRMNSANTQQLKGYELIKQIKNRALKPIKVVNCFHIDCNPQPAPMNLQILKLGFSNISLKQTRQIIQQWSEQQLKKLGILNSISSYDSENKMVVIQFQKKIDYLKCQQFVDKSLKDLNESLKQLCKFAKKDVFLDTQIYQNVIKQLQIKEQNAQKSEKKRFVKKNKVDSNQKQEQSEKKKEQSSTQQLINEVKPKNFEEKTKIKSSNNLQQKQKQTKQQMVLSSPRGNFLNKNEKTYNPKQQIDVKSSSISRRFSITFTHIQPKLKQQLKKFIDSISKCKKNYQFYENSIQVFFATQDQMVELLINIQQKIEDVNLYGFKGEIIFGFNTGSIFICNFDKRKIDQIKNYLVRIVGKELKDIQICRSGNSFQLRMDVGKPLSCKWLDKILVDKSIKQFKITGAGNRCPKMKFYLQCQNPFYE